MKKAWILYYVLNYSGRMSFCDIARCVARRTKSACSPEYARRVLREANKSGKIVVQLG